MVGLCAHLVGSVTDRYNIQSAILSSLLIFCEKWVELTYEAQCVSNNALVW